jgi:hypothetical protein
MIASLITSPELTYPEADAFFSPDVAFPEYSFEHLASRPNPVYAAVRELLAQVGLDRENFGTKNWNPLGSAIHRGASVFVLCNFVAHRRVRESLEDFRAKCIDGSVLRALLDYVLLAAGHQARIRFGNAPVQSCHWESVLRDTRADKVIAFYQRMGIAIEARDLRLRVVKRSALGRMREVELRDAGRNSVEVDLGGDSMLAEFSSDSVAPPRFRVTDYAPGRTEAFHARGAHRYVIHREILESDVVVNLSKLKTHGKVGITCGLKGLVGAVGHKDCLAHHRFGSPAIGGDEYPPSLRFLHPLSRLQDWINQRGDDAPLQGPLQIADRSLGRVLRRLGIRTGGAWHGNDTAWRMALDLARIAHYSDAQGRMCARPQRMHLSLIDGIVGGEGEGPLSPRPVAAGSLLFSDDVAVGDRLACRLMGFPPEAFPLVRRAFELERHPLSNAPDASVCHNGESVPEQNIAPVLGRTFRPPPGWARHLRRTAPPSRSRVR